MEWKRTKMLQIIRKEQQILMNLKQEEEETNIVSIELNINAQLI